MAASVPHFENINDTVKEIVWSENEHIIDGEHFCSQVIIHFSGKHPLSSA